MLDQSEYYQRFMGRFVAIRKWEELDLFWQVLLDSAPGWYVYAPGEVPPQRAASGDELQRFISEVDQLLRRDHDEDYCGIVYVDDRNNPDFLKIYDPNNLGSVCGSSGAPPLPGWVLSRLPPIDLPAARPQSGSRRRWWQKVFSAA